MKIMEDFHYWKFKRKIAPYLFLLPGLIMLSLFFFWPILNTFRYSFCKYDVITPPVYIGLQNYNRLLTDQSFIQALQNTVKYSLIVVPCLIVIPLFLALLIDQNLKYIKFFRVLYYLPRIMSLVVAGVIWKFMFQSDGVINSLLTFVGFGKVGWLSSPKVAIFSVAILTIWIASAYYMIIYLAGLQSIPVSLIESAKIDGASKFRRLWHIIIPLMKPYILTVTLVSTVGAMRVFGEVYILTSGGPGGATNVLTYFVYQRAFSFMKMGYASAAASILLGILIIVSIIYMYLFSKGEIK